MDPLPLAAAATRGLQVTFRCMACGALSARPAAHLVRRYGASSLAEVAGRARCLAYRQGERCRGAAEVGYAAPPPGPAPEAARL